MYSSRQERTLQVVQNYPGIIFFDEIDSLLPKRGNSTDSSNVSDRMIALELGRPIVEGTPEEVTTNPRVVSSYLGGDMAVINRSGANQGPAHTDDTADTAHRNGNGSSNGSSNGNGAGPSAPRRRRAPLVAANRENR